MAVLFALISALAFGIGDVITRIGVRSGTPFTGAVISGMVMIIVFTTPVFLAEPSDRPLWLGVGWFFAMGLLLTGPGRILYYSSVRRIGVARATVLINISPLVGMLFAVVFLGGAALSPAGARRLSHCRWFDGAGHGSRGHTHFTPSAFLGNPATFFFSLTPLFIRVGMQSLPDPILGSFISGVGGIIFLLVSQPAIPWEDRWKADRRSFVCFGIAGLIFVVAFVTYYEALGRAEVSLVTPLVFTSPLLSVLIARLFLQNLERVTWRLIAGGVAIFFGAVIVSLFRAG